jgi:Protein of unknown function (DUF2795)
MTKSKKQFTQPQTQGTTEEFHRTVQLAFGDIPWPASRAELLEHASRQGMFAKSDLARLKRIPSRDYHSVSDMMDAMREADMAMAQPGPVATAEHNRRAMGEAPTKVRTHSADRFDEPIH